MHPRPLHLQIPPPWKNLVDASFTDVILKQHKHLEVGGSFVHKNHGSRIFTLVGCAR